ncbi:uncharacterized protein EI90DRAFT_3068208 [Cantharellus anzutake]|uniref:uncharacterized protein n=1 Tax=Cantharellus anzutake TaxID=1750568 RepID=UPI00190873A0|nr:uncharacterized protein EI90DRAFT_3068208 [Cantharellus anzutake]KAF8327184.1 hypothetical protein EI90DRAFT_3068208 [Cantharellus anzutake]
MLAHRRNIEEGITWSAQERSSNPTEATDPNFMRYLLSRGLDPLLGVFTGVLAYKMSESNPRTAPPPGDTLVRLVKWKLNSWKSDREQRLRDDGTRVTRTKPTDTIPSA